MPSGMHIIPIRQVVFIIFYVLRDHRNHKYSGKCSLSTLFNMKKTTM